MSTPEPSGVPVGDASPAELRLVSAAAPSPARPPAIAHATPGAGAAVLRAPGAPTLPDADPASLALAVARLANELFAAPTAPAVPTPEPGARHDALRADPGAGASAAHGPSGASPFDAPLSFDSLALPPVFSMDLGAPSPTASPGRSAPYAPYWLAPDATRPEPSQPVVTGFELAPTTAPSLPTRGSGALDPHAVRAEFPILEERVHGRRLVWLDNAATTQKPRAVIERLRTFYERENSNVHRAAHTLAARATDAYEGARARVRRFLGASSSDEVVFVRGATEGINLVAQSWGRRNVGAGDEVLVSWLEHHANIVPWQQLCAERGARLRVAPVDDRGQVILEEYERLLGPRTKLVAFTQVSNALGTITPAAEMVAMARRHGACTLVDGAQAVSHMRVDVAALGCDFYVFSGHKVFAPTGIGAVYGRREVLEATPPWQGGGNMIEDVTFERTRFQPPPARFEAGTGNIADAVGLGAAIDWLERLGVEAVGRYEHELLRYGTERLAEVPGLHLVGTAHEKAGVLSFVLDGQRTQDVGAMLDREGIAVRSGHHCAQPILRRFGLEATVRASLAPYNTREDLDALVEALQRIQHGR